MNSSTKEFPSELEFASQESTEFAGCHAFEKSRFLTEIKPSGLEIWNLENWKEKKILKKLIQEFAPKTVQTEFVVRHAFERKTVCWLKSNLQTSNLVSRELYEQENLTHFIQEICSKAVQTDFSVRHAFERKVTFWLNLNL